jgi:hypothetical protein
MEIWTPAPRHQLLLVLPRSSSQCGQTVQDREKPCSALSLRNHGLHISLARAYSRNILDEAADSKRLEPTAFRIQLIDRKCDHNV